MTHAIDSQALTDEQSAALVALHYRPEPGTTAPEVVANLLGGALAAQLEEPSDDQTLALQAVRPDAEAFVWFTDLADRIGQAIEHTISEWLGDFDRPDVGLPYARPEIREGVYAVVCPECGERCEPIGPGTSEDDVTKGALRSYMLHYAESHA